MTDPVLSGDGSLSDQIIAGLDTQGFSEGTINDRERARLEAKLSSSDSNKSISDLYEEASEDQRIAGEV